MRSFLGWVIGILGAATIFLAVVLWLVWNVIFTSDPHVKLVASFLPWLPVVVLAAIVGVIARLTRPKSRG